jgi:hypothetical protein
MDILPIQASSVPCERVFSSSKETTTPRRNKLHPQLVEALQVLKFGQKHATGLSFTEGLNINDVGVELKAIEESCDPEDLYTFLQTYI